MKKVYNRPFKYCLEQYNFCAAFFHFILMNSIRSTLICRCLYIMKNGNIFVYEKVYLD